MTELPSRPNLSPQFCFSSGALRDFLRFSRSAVDDTITEHINALATPSHAGFDPGSTAQRSPVSGSRPISSEACDSFKRKVLFSTWAARTEALDYCALVAASPDPNDPEATLRDIEMQRDRERVVDERLDPYSGRFFPREARTQVLASLVRQERGVEGVVRNRTWSVVQERCNSSTRGTWQEAMEKCGFDGK
ncbi:caffeine-induced death protein Cid2 [Pochonia chlamydosporia 170]|uniref:Caffeine-induced death protein Cid2 n=1 Tax=Pochonia chlamydosporia 170 TaxID=1380566 RepID=A0A179FFE8_METCM|nr:caffeine-induced death protein Cid2 [Pochonia chlamydosporia 170]OAQ64127.1 caffeine-induced death protein Cid2 [Pochonia chlamydosporia 170]